MIPFHKTSAADYGPQFQVEVVGQTAQSPAALAINVEWKTYRPMRINTNCVISKPRRAVKDLFQRNVLVREVPTVSNSVEAKLNGMTLFNRFRTPSSDVSCRRRVSPQHTLNYYRLEAGRFENFVSYGLKSFAHEERREHRAIRTLDFKQT
jgi:hypothetical protein